MIRNAVIIIVQQKKRPQVLVRLPLVHRFSLPSALQALKLFCLQQEGISTPPMSKYAGQKLTSQRCSLLVESGPSDRRAHTLSSSLRSPWMGAEAGRSPNSGSFYTREPWRTGCIPPGHRSGAVDGCRKHCSHRTDRMAHHCVGRCIERRSHHTPR